MTLLLWDFNVLSFEWFNLSKVTCPAHGLGLPVFFINDMGAVVSLLRLAVQCPLDARLWVGVGCCCAGVARKLFLKITLMQRCVL